MNVLRLQSVFRLGKALVISIPLIAAQAIVPALVQPFGIDVSVGIANAQSDDKTPPKKKERKTKRTQAMNPKVYEKLVLANAAVEAKSYDEALTILKEMAETRRKLNEAEQASVLNTYAYIYYIKEDFPNAIKSYRDIIAIPDGPEGVQVAARYSLAQMYFVTEEWENAIDALNDWFSVTEIAGANSYVLLAQAYNQVKRFDPALKNVEIAISMYREEGKIPKENWLNMQRFFYYEKNNTKKVVEILEELLIHYPKKVYWQHLSAMHGDLKDESKQLAAMETAYVQGMLEKEKEVLNMAYMLLSSDVPYKAAKVMDKGIRDKVIEPTSKNLEVLGNAWRQSQEIKKAIPVMAEAARKSDKGELWTRLCNVYLDGDRYQEAVDSCENGLKKGGVKRPDTANLVLGMAHFNLKQYKSARKAFENAAKDKRSAKYAKQWMNFMAKELERQKSLQES